MMDTQEKKLQSHQGMDSALKKCKKHHQELRESYLGGLAEAIVLERNPNLVNDYVKHMMPLL